MYLSKHARVCLTCLSNKDVRSAEVSSLVNSHACVVVPLYVCVRIRWADDLRARLDRSERKCLQLEPKGREHGELSERCARSEAQLLSSQAQVAAQQESLTEAQASARSATARVGDLEHAVGYLEMDKGYLQKEVEKAYNRSDRAERAVEACQEKLREAETSKEQLGAALEQLRNESRAAYDDRIGSELARARAATAAELSSIREGLGSVHRRECETLREARGKDLVQGIRLGEASHFHSVCAKYINILLLSSFLSFQLPFATFSYFLHFYKCRQHYNRALCLS